MHDQFLHRSLDFFFRRITDWTICQSWAYRSRGILEFELVLPAQYLELWLILKIIYSGRKDHLSNQTNIKSPSTYTVKPKDDYRKRLINIPDGITISMAISTEFFIAFWEFKLTLKIKIQNIFTFRPRWLNIFFST